MLLMTFSIQKFNIFAICLIMEVVCGICNSNLNFKTLH